MSLGVLMSRFCSDPQGHRLSRGHRELDNCSSRRADLHTPRRETSSRRREDLWCGGLWAQPRHREDVSLLSDGYPNTPNFSWNQFMLISCSFQSTFGDPSHLQQPGPYPRALGTTNNESGHWEKGDREARFPRSLLQRSLPDKQELFLLCRHRQFDVVQVHTTLLELTQFTSYQIEQLVHLTRCNGDRSLRLVMDPFTLRLGCGSGCCFRLLLFVDVPGCMPRSGFSIATKVRRRRTNTQRERRKQDEGGGGGREDQGGWGRGVGGEGHS
jgi:hypothetical protein